MVGNSLAADRKLPLSVFIICQNEVERLPLALAAVQDLADDIVVVDSGSTDGTIEVARSFTDRVHHRDWEGYGQQKVYAEGLCRNDWILNIDADEILLDDVKASIRAIFETPEAERPAAYSLRIRHVAMSARSLRPGLFNPTNVTPRLYDRRRAGFKDSAVHDKVIIRDGSKAVTLKGDVAHISLKSYMHIWEKTGSYSRMSAEERARKGHKPPLLLIVADPLWFFFKNYIIRRLFAVGLEGFVIATILSAGRALRLALTREIVRKQESAKQSSDR
ncbi:glycosyltransferase family 2 protein [Shinella sp.]|uniref:glycosyltransferase family 2 protein n=1 Tax=Shinella sp. TaxID=1870904 RepID=UPI004036F08A